MWYIDNRYTPWVQILHLKLHCRTMRWPPGAYSFAFGARWLCQQCLVRSTGHDRWRQLRQKTSNKDWLAKQKNPTRFQQLWYKCNTKIVYTCIPNGEKPLSQPLVPIGEVSLVTWVDFDGSTALHLAATRRSGEPWTFSSSQTFKANGMPTTNKSNNKVQQVGNLRNHKKQI